MITTKYIIALLIIIFGAITHATSKLKIAKDRKEPFTWKDFMILVPLSGFAGLMFGILAEIVFQDSANLQWYLWFACGMGSFLGLAGLSTIFNIFLDILSKRR